MPTVINAAGGSSRKIPPKMSTALSKVTSEVGLVTKVVKVQTARGLLGCSKGREKTACRSFEVWGLNARAVT